MRVEVIKKYLVLVRRQCVACRQKSTFEEQLRAASCTLLEEGNTRSPWTVLRNNHINRSPCIMHTGSGLGLRLPLVREREGKSASGSYGDTSYSLAGNVSIQDALQPGQKGELIFPSP